MIKTTGYLIVLSLVLLTSCNQTQKVNCINRPDVYLMLGTGDTSVKMVYTALTLSAYKSGTNFTTPDSLVLNTGGTDTFKQSLIRIGAPYLSAVFDQRDWIITFYPSGKQFKIRNITRHPKTEKMANDKVMDGVKCINGFSYYVNDSLVNVPAQDVIYQQAREEEIFILYR